MPERVDVASLYAAIEKSAGLLDVTVSPDTVLPVLTAYEDALDQAVIAFRVATNARHEGEFDFRFTLPKSIDPYARALSNGLTDRTGHPVENLLSEIQQQCPIDSYGIDAGVVGGFKKAWVYFPGDRYQSLSKLAGLPSMPRSLREHADFFTRYGLSEKPDVIGIDYHSRTMNVYFAEPPQQSLRPEAVLAMHREIGAPDPSEQMLRFCGLAFGMYTTLNWDSAKIERIAFGVKTHDPLGLPARIGEKIERFLKSYPYAPDAPKMVYAAMTSAGEEYYKLQAYYRFRSRSRLNLMASADSAGDSA